MSNENNRRTALVTGSSRGIGQEIKQYFIKQGIFVLSPTRQEMDLCSNKSIDCYINSLEQNIDILVNNAGINPLGGVKEIKDDDIENTIQVNMYAPLRLIRGLAPKMAARGFGRIVNISSIWSNVSKPGRISYAMSKSGVNALTRTIAIELAKDNVLINAVAPGFVNTELTRINNSVETIHTIEQNLPIGRLAEPEEIAELVGFLCSPRNTYIVGQTIFIDGGYTCL